MNYVALGDSITARRAEVKVYFERLQGDGLPFTEMINSGIGGWKTSDLLLQLDSKCLSFRPTVVTLMLGTNDHTIYKETLEPAVSLADFESNLVHIVESIVRIDHGEVFNRGHPQVILMTPPYVASYLLGGSDLNQARLLQYCEVIKKVSQWLNTGFVDINTITGTATDWADTPYFENYTHRNDGEHLNSLGHQIIHPHITAAIRKAIDEGELK